MALVPFSTVCFRAKADDAINQRIIDHVNATGKIFVSHTKLNDKLTIRLAIGNLRTTEEHVRMAWELIVEAYGELR
jgi:aromatic-L-amino-acid decarboxylase